MKKQFLTILLLASSLLASCERNIEENANNSISGNINEETNLSQTIPNTQRMSYQEYSAKYSSLLNTESDQQNTNNTITDDNTDTTSSNTSDMATENSMLATYSTPLQSSTNERINNLEIVCDRLNNFILKPQETFSYNNVTGPFGPDDGFEEATIMLKDGSKTEGYGGGVCQLSSTIYNVVKNIDNVEITERHHHSSPVSYVPKGEDATISLQSGLDFKFINHNDYSIQFKAKCADGKVSVWAYKVL